jgi:hypothetical protein
MASKWLPHSEGNFVTWFINWNNKLISYSVLFGLSAGDLLSVANDLLALQFLVSISAIFKAKTQDINLYKFALIHGPGPIGSFPGNPTLPATPASPVLADMIARIDIMVARLKAHSSYTAVIGEDLGIESPAAGPPSPGTPSGEATAQPNSEVRLAFVKGDWSGIYIESQRGAETAWTPLGFDMHSPYVDTRAPLVAGQAEQRRYRIRFLDGDTPVGPWSDVISVSTIP